MRYLQRFFSKLENVCKALVYHLHSTKHFQISGPTDEMELAIKFFIYSISEPHYSYFKLQTWNTNDSFADDLNLE